MILDVRSERRLGVLAMVGLLLLTGCSGDDDSSSSGSSGNNASSGGGGGGGGGGRVTFSCEKAGKFCIEYTGSTSNIDTIREATKCADQGAVEGTGCTKGGAAVCALPQNGSTGTSGAQYNYGTFEEDDLTALRTTCERNGGTFTAP